MVITIQHNAAHGTLHAFHCSLPAGVCGAGTCAGDDTTPALNLIMGVRDGMMVEKALMMLILDMMMGGMILLQLI